MLFLSILEAYEEHRKTYPNYYRIPAVGEQIDKYGNEISLKKEKERERDDGHTKIRLKLTK